MFFENKYEVQHSIYIENLIPLTMAKYHFAH